MGEVPKVALVTAKDYPGLTKDDRLLLPELERLGLEGVPVVWDEPGVKWSLYSAAVLRSTWDYYRRPQEFLEWLPEAARQTRLWNPVRTVQWNMRKTYLRDLGDRGLPVIPTVYLAGPSGLPSLLARQGWDRAVVKPSVSAGAHKTFLLSAQDTDRIASLVPELAGAGELMVQPYLDEVERGGERSLVFLEGRFSHAFLRAPKLGLSGQLREGAPCDPTEKELFIGQSAVSAAPDPPLYARVDLVGDEAGTPRIMELELIEPALWLQNHPEAASQFARAIRARIS